MVVLTVSAAYVFPFLSLQASPRASPLFTQSDNYWLNSRTPCLTYGLRGLVYFKLTVSGPARDLHSGVFGRMVHEPMTDLVLLMSKLVDQNGKILVPGVDEMVEPADAEER